MITLTKLNKETFALNSDLIETMTENPDTTIVLVGGKYFIVRETMQEVVQKIIEFRRQIYGNYINKIFE